MRPIMTYQYILIRLSDIKVGFGVMLLTVQCLFNMFRVLCWSSSNVYTYVYIHTFIHQHTMTTQMLINVLTNLVIHNFFGGTYTCTSQKTVKHTHTHGPTMHSCALIIHKSIFKFTQKPLSFFDFMAALFITLTNWKQFRHPVTLTGSKRLSYSREFFQSFSCYRDPCKSMFIAPLFTVAKLWKQPYFSTTEGQIKK